MWLPVWRRSPDSRAERVVLAALLALCLVAGFGRVGLADDAEFTATVKVDATGENVIKARETARLDGQRRALAAVAERVAATTATALDGTAPPAASAAKLPKLDDKVITSLVESFEVANERMSAVRYIADYTFHFRPDAVRRIVRVAGPANSGPASPGPAGAEPQQALKPPGPAARIAVLLPVYQAEANSVLWGDPNPWREAWTQARPSGRKRLVVPPDDLSSLATIDADRALAGDAEALTAIGRQNGSDETVVALANLRGAPEMPSAVDLGLQFYRAGQLADSYTESIVANPGEAIAPLLRRVVAAAIAHIESDWNKSLAPRYDQPGQLPGHLPGHLTVMLPISGLDEWVRVREQLSALPAIRKIALLALSLQEATITLDYAGSLDELRTSLAAAGLALSPGGPPWRLARSGGTASE